jgi:hypothetical protein
MSKYLICISDTHFRKDEPFFNAQKEFVEWFIKQEFNNSDNYFIHIGDVLNSSIPNPDAIDLAIHMNNNLKFKEKHYLVGSHDYNRTKNSYACTSLGREKNTKIIYEPENIKIGNLRCLLLPFLYDKTEFLGNQTMKEFYENYKNVSDDFIFYHFQNSKIKFSKEDENGIDITNLSGELIGGHIHKRQENYLGSCLIQRFDEKGKESYILKIDIETKEREYILSPKFLDYEEINYENPKSEFLNRAEEFLKYERIFNIINSPSEDAAREKFKGLYIHEIKLKPNEEDDVYLQESEKENKTILDYFDSFCEKTKINKKLKEIVIPYLGE